jgi:hypothetical protein
MAKIGQNMPEIAANNLDKLPNGDVLKFDICDLEN